MQPDPAVIMADQLVRLVVIWGLQAIVWTAIGVTGYLLASAWLRR